jgi:hypothetical protein
MVTDRKEEERPDSSQIELSPPSGDSIVITGWVTASVDPNDDNAGFWCASEGFLASWSYTVTARP